MRLRVGETASKSTYSNFNWCKRKNNYNRPAVGIFESIWTRMDATATTSYDLSPMSSQIASFMAADWSLILIGIMPGESSNSKSLPKRTHLQEKESDEFQHYSYHTSCNCNHLDRNKDYFMSWMDELNALLSKLKEWDPRTTNTMNVIWNCFSKYRFEFIIMYKLNTIIGTYRLTSALW